MWEVVAEMKRVLKRFLWLPIKLFGVYLHWASTLWPGIRISYLDQVYAEIEQLTETVRYSAPDRPVIMSFYAPNSVCRYRSETFATKEPETLRWIEKFGGGTFFDIGANIGLYSIFYAKLHRGQVFAFEPSAMNQALLAKNVAANGVNKQVTIFPLPLCDEWKRSEFQLSMLDEGGSMSQFGGESHESASGQLSVLSYETVGVPLDAVVEDPFFLDQPELLKMDVDGIEDLILLGGQKVLQNRMLESVLIEVDESFPSTKARIESILSDSGLSFVAKERASMFDDGRFAECYNQVWVR